MEEFKRAAESTMSWLGAAKKLDVHFNTFKKYAAIYKIDTSHFNSNREFHVKYDPIDLSAKRTWEKRYMDGSLTFEEFKTLSQQQCYYCLASPSNVANWYKSDKRSSQERIDAANFIYNGLDRVDNSRPHDSDNVVPCCFRCNVAKMCMTRGDFHNQIVKMIRWRAIYYEGDYTRLIVPMLKGIKPPSIVRRPWTIAQVVEPEAIFGRLTIVKQVESISNRKAFLCLCECGKEKIITGYDIRVGKTISCGGPGICQMEFPPVVSTARVLWINAGYKKEGLSFDSFWELSQMPCIYCGKELSNCFNPPSIKAGAPFIYNGIDRIDSTRPHTVDNVIPSCWDCNRMKSKGILADFDTWLTAINNHWLSKG